MEIKGKVHCFFEQSGTFKNEFIKLGIPAEDYDIQNHFGQTDHTDDLFQAIEDAYDGKPSLFDNITPDDLIMAFFPCIFFCQARENFRGSVGRVIVDHDQFKIGKGLGKNAFNGFFQICFPVIDAHNNRNFGCVFHGFILL